MHEQDPNTAQPIVPLYPITEPESDERYIYDTKAAAEQLGISEREIMQLTRSGRLLFKFNDTAGVYRTSQREIDTERRTRQNQKWP
jgi:hypothetical protein